MASPHHTESIDWGLVGQVGSWIVGGLGLLGITKQNIPKISEWIVKKLDTETAKRARMEAAVLRHKREDRDEAMAIMKETVEYFKESVSKQEEINSNLRRQVNELLLLVGKNTEQIDQVKHTAQQADKKADASMAINNPEVIDRMIHQSQEPTHE